MLQSLFQKNLHVVCCARMHHVPRHVQQVSLTAEIKFCGLTCENPFFLASSAVCTNYEMVAKAFDAGWAAMSARNASDVISAYMSALLAPFLRQTV